MENKDEYFILLEQPKAAVSFISKCSSLDVFVVATKMRNYPIRYRPKHTSRIFAVKKLTC